MHPKDYRLKEKLSAAAMAEAIGVTTRAIHQYEAGERRPGWAVMGKYFEISKGQVTANDFYTSDQPAAPEQGGAV